MALETLLLEKNFGNKDDKKNVKGEKIEANGDASCPGGKQTWVGINHSEKPKRKTGILKPAG